MEVQKKDRVESNLEQSKRMRVIQLGNGQSILRRIENSKSIPNRNKSYKTLVQANTCSQTYTTDDSMQDNSSFIVNCKY